MSSSFLKQFVSKAKGDAFLQGSAVLFFGSLIVGIINYLYQFLMARLLTVEMYGEVQSLLAILSVIAVLSGAISMVTIKYTAEFAAKEEWNKVSSLLRIFSEKIFLFSGLGYILYVIVSGQIAMFLNLSSRFSVLLLGIALIFGFTSAVPFGILRALQKFKELSVVTLFIAFLKLVFSVLFIKMGFGVNGAIVGVVLASVLGYGFSFYPITFLPKKQREPIGGKKMFRYSLPVLGSLLFTTLLWSVDMVLVKHYFSPVAAGEYAALAMIGHILFFVVGPISLVLFPLAASAHASQNFPAKVLKKALFLTILIGGIFVGAYFLVPGLIISILVGSKFLSLTGYLGWFGVSMLLYALVNVFANYFLSIGETKIVGGLALTSLLQIVLLMYFHDTLWHILWVMNGVMVLGLIFLVAYFVKLYYLCPKK